jgi:5'-nucleotidase
MRFLVDLDGVCCNTLAKMLELYNNEYNDSLTTDDLHDWHTHKCVKEECGTSVYQYFDGIGFFGSLEPRPGCSEVLSEIQADGHDIVIVTAVHATALTAHFDKVSWVRQHLPFLGFKNVISAHRKYLVSGDILLDDSPENISSFPGLTCVFDWPYNKSVPSTHRVSSWHEFRDLYRSEYKHRL